MNKNVPLDQMQDSEVSETELDAVIDTNKELFDQLNAIPEIEALEAISIEDEKQEKDKEINQRPNQRPKSQYKIFTV